MRPYQPYQRPACQLTWGSGISVGDSTVELNIESSHRENPRDSAGVKHMLHELSVSPERSFQVVALLEVQHLK